ADRGQSNAGAVPGARRIAHAIAAAAHSASVEATFHDTAPPSPGTGAPCVNDARNQHAKAPQNSASAAASRRAGTGPRASNRELMSNEGTASAESAGAKSVHMEPSAAPGASARAGGRAQG